MLKQMLQILLVSIAIVDLTLANYLRVLSDTGDQCGALETTHTATVSLNLYGNPDSLSEEDVGLLCEVIEEAYDGVSSYPCLNVVEVEADSDTDRRELRPEVYDMNSRGLDDGEVDFDFTFVFFITYQCNGCPEGGLFNDASRRKILEVIEERKKPERSAFTENFNEILKKSSVASKVERLNLISEEKEVSECGLKTTGLKTELSIAFEGSYKSLLENQEEKDTLQQTVMKSYNTMNQPNPYTCDKLFRKIESVVIDDVYPIDHSSFLVNFKLGYECRGCKSAELFDVSIFDAEREDLYVDFQVFGPKEQECSCDIAAKSNRGPTRDEFSRALERTIEIRTAQNKISTVTEIATNEIIIMELP